MGTRWVYHKKRSIGSEDETEVITAVKWRGREAFVTIAVEGLDGKLIPGRTMWLKADGAYCVAYGDGKRFEWPRCHIRTPLRPGTAWEMCWPGFKFLMTARAMEEVVVPAGKFTAVRVDVVGWFVDDPTPARWTDWYVEGIGRVKSVDHEGKTDVALKSFSPGKN